jgi:hypothetical protein
MWPFLQHFINGLSAAAAFAGVLGEPGAQGTAGDQKPLCEFGAVGVEVANDPVPEILV